MPALHPALIKYTADDVSLALGWNKTSAQTVVTIKPQDPSFVCSEVIKINLPKHLHMQIKHSAD